MAAPPSYDAALSSDTKYPPYQQDPNMAYPPPQNSPYPPQNTPYPQDQNFSAYPGPPAPPPVAVNPPPQDDTAILYGKSSDELIGIVSFDNKIVRLGFIRKVFAILGLQMAATIAVTAWFMFHEPTKLFVQENLAVYLVAYGLFFILYFVLACCTGVARKHPTNLILLGLFTLSLSYMVAAISSYHNTEIVLAAFGITLLVTVAIIGFASQTKYDFTTCGGVLFVCSFALFFFGIFAAIFVPLGYISILNVVYSALGALLFMAFLAFDTQLIIGGRKYDINPEDYIFAAMMLYVDVIYIFLFILSLLGGSSN